jgi:hypothetical protein
MPTVIFPPAAGVPLGAAPLPAAGVLGAPLWPLGAAVPALAVSLVPDAPLPLPAAGLALPAAADLAPAAAAFEPAVLPPAAPDEVAPAFAVALLPAPLGGVPAAVLSPLAPAAVFGFSAFPSEHASPNATTPTAAPACSRNFLRLIEESSLPMRAGIQPTAHIL